MKSRDWILLGVVGGFIALSAACSSDFKSCYDTRTCPPAAGAGSGGDAGDDSSAGSPKSAGAGGNLSAGGDQTDAGAAGESIAGAPSGGRSGGAGGATDPGGSGGTLGGGAGSAGNAGSAGTGGAPLAFGTCRPVPENNAANIPTVVGAATPPTLTQGQFRAGRYHRSQVAYYSSIGGGLTGLYVDAAEVELKDNVAAVYFYDQTWLFAMGTPPSAPAQSIKIICSSGNQLSNQLGIASGVELKESVSYQADTGGFQFLIVGNGYWYLVGYSIEK